MLKFGCLVTGVILVKDSIRQFSSSYGFTFQMFMFLVCTNGVFSLGFAFSRNYFSFLHI